MLSTENHLQRGVTAYHPKTAIPLIAHPRASTDGSVDSQLRPRHQPLSTSGQLFLNPEGGLPAPWPPRGGEYSGRPLRLVDTRRDRNVSLFFLFFFLPDISEISPSIETFDSARRKDERTRSGVRIATAVAPDTVGQKPGSRFRSYLRIDFNPEERDSPLRRQIDETKSRRRYFHGAFLRQAACGFESARSATNGLSKVDDDFVVRATLRRDPEVISIPPVRQASTSHGKEISSGRVVVLAARARAPGNSVGTAVAGFSLLPCFLPRG